MGQASSERTFIHQERSSDANAAQQRGNCKIKQASRHNVWIWPPGVSQCGFKLIPLENNCCKWHIWTTRRHKNHLTKTKTNKTSKEKRLFYMQIAKYQSGLTLCIIQGHCMTVKVPADTHKANIKWPQREQHTRPCHRLRPQLSENTKASFLLAVLVNIQREAALSWRAITFTEN